MRDFPVGVGYCPRPSGELRESFRFNMAYVSVVNIGGLWGNVLDTLLERAAQRQLAN